MLNGNGLFMMITIVAGYFYFLGSDHRKDFERTMGALIAPQSLQHRYDLPQENEMTSKAPPAAPTSPAILSAPEEVHEQAITLPALPPRQYPERPRPPRTLLNQFRTPIAFKQDHSAFQMLRLRAIARHAYTAEMGDIVDERMNLIFFDPTDPATHGPMTFPVVLNEDNGQLGILSGTLIVSMKYISQASQVAQRFGLALKGQDDSLAKAYLGSSQADDVGPLIAQLRQDPSVRAVEAEIVQSWNRQ